MASPIRNSGRSASSFDIRIEVQKGIKIRNISLETTTPAPKIYAKIDHYDEDGHLVAHLKKGFFSNLGSWSVPLEWAGEYEILRDGSIKASILNDSGIDIFCNLIVIPED